MSNINPDGTINPIYVVEFVRGYTIYEKRENKSLIPKGYETFLDKDIAFQRYNTLNASYKFTKPRPVMLVKNGSKYYKVNVRSYNVRDAADVFGIKDEVNADSP